MSFVHSLFSLEGRNGVVTGAALRARPSLRGHVCPGRGGCGSARVNAAGLTDAAAEVTALGDRVLPVEADVSDADAVKRAVARFADGLGRCEFSRPRLPGEGIPAMVVDEEIYRRLPTLLIATVDKFA